MTEQYLSTRKVACQIVDFVKLAMRKATWRNKVSPEDVEHVTAPNEDDVKQKEVVSIDIPKVSGLNSEVDHIDSVFGDYL